MYSLRDRWIDIFNQRYPELDTLLEDVNTKSEQRKIAYRFLVEVMKSRCSPSMKLVSLTLSIKSFLPNFGKQFLEFCRLICIDNYIRVQVSVVNLVHQFPASAAGRQNLPVACNCHNPLYVVFLVCYHAGDGAVFGTETYAAGSRNARTKVHVALICD